MHIHHPSKSSLKPSNHALDNAPAQGPCILVKYSFIIDKIQHIPKCIGRSQQKCIQLIVVAMLCISLTGCQRAHYTEWVNPFIGTGGHGHTFPGACYPFGMMQLSPDTRLEGWDGCSGYHDSDSIIYGFSHTHLSGTGIADYADFLFMPGSSAFHEELFKNSHYQSLFRKNNEVAKPGYYKVFLEKDGIEAELTVGKRTGMHRYHYPRGERPWVLVDLGHRDPVLVASFTHWSANSLEAVRHSSSWAKDQRLYLAARFNKPVREFAFSKDSMQIILFFDKDVNNTLLIHTAISAVDAEGARKNMESEWNDFDFDALFAQTNKSWSEHLGRIQVNSGNPVHLTNFYTALYHNLIHPSLYQDADGRYRTMGQQISNGPADDHFTVFSLWDTYRSTHPLYQLVYPDYNARFIRTFLRQFESSGHLPVWELAANETWCMIGHHSIPVIANAWIRKDFNFDTILAKKAVYHTLKNSEYSGLPFMNKGFIASNEVSESVSKTLENSLDFGAAQSMGLALPPGFSPYNYRNMLNPSSGFFQAKLNHSFIEPFDPREVNFHFTEANAYQYWFGAHHDVDGLLHLMGGQQSMETNLDRLFGDESQLTGREQADITGLIGQYAHGNEPSHHIAYLYNYVNAPTKTQALVKRIKETFYHNRPDGLIGNEDCGQMSSWYVFSALGFYPVHPYSRYFDLGHPSFQKAKIKVPGKKTIFLNQDSKQSGSWVESLQCNDHLVSTRFALDYGDRLTFNMGSKPTFAKYLPEKTGLDFIGQPFVKSGTQVFTDSVCIELASPQGMPLEYCLDHLSTDRKQYVSPVCLKSSGSIFFRHKSKNLETQWLKADFFKKPGNRQLKLLSQYANQYAASGKDALIDGVKGGGDYRDGFWQGCQGIDLLGIIEMDTMQQVNGCSIRFLQDQKSWILLPSEIQISYSEDGKTYTLCPVMRHNIPKDLVGSVIREFEIPIQKKCRFIKFHALNAGPMPDWHLGAGGASWIFCDEVTIH